MAQVLTAAQLLLRMGCKAMLLYRYLPSDGHLAYCGG
jgi:hypothetical protein